MRLIDMEEGQYVTKKKEGWNKLYIYYDGISWNYIRESCHNSVVKKDSTVWKHDDFVLCDFNDIVIDESKIFNKLEERMGITPTNEDKIMEDFDYRGYSIIINKSSLGYRHILTDRVIAYLIMDASHSQKDKFIKLVDCYLKG